MPRPSTRRVDALPESPAPARQQAATEVVARPVAASVVAPQGEMFELVNALRAVEPGLTEFLEKRHAEQAEAERVAGAKARAAQSGNEAVLTPEQTPFFQQGYMQMHGEVAGRDSARRMRAAFEEKKNLPDFDADAFFREFSSEELKGMTDKDALKGFLPALIKEREALRDEYSKLQVERVRQDTDANLAARARDLAEMRFSGEELAGTTASAQRHALYQDYVQKGLALGKTRPELAEMFTAALINEALAKQDPAVLDAASHRDASGIALLDNPKLGRAILEARSKAEELQKKSIYEAGTQYRTDTLVGLEEMLRVDPSDPQLDLPALYSHAHKYGLFNDPDGKELAAFWARVVDARSKQGTLVNIRASLYGPNGRIAAARPEAKPLIDAEYGKLWDAWELALNGGDERATERFIVENLSRHQQWGVADERLKALLSRINTEPDKDGKPSPDFLRAYRAYSAIKNSPNYDLISDLTDERSRTLLRYFHDMIVDEKQPEAAAFAKAKKLMEPEAQERLKALATPEVRAKFRSELDSRLKKGDWYTFGFTGKPGNSGMFVNTLTNAFERKLAILGDVEAAQKQTLAEIDVYLSRDANDNWTVRPDSTALAGRSQVDFDKGLKAYTLDLADALAKEAKATGGSDPSIHLERIGQGTAYTVMNHGVPVGRVELSEILARGEAKHVTAAQAVSLSALSKRIHDNGGKHLTGDEIEGSWGEILQLHRIGKINSSQLDVLATRRQAWKRERLAEAEKAALEGRAAALGGMDPKDVLREPGGLPEAPARQPGGKNLKTADYAMQAMQKGNLLFALTAQAEGFMTRAHDDPSRGRNIGVGFSMTARTQPEVMSMLRRAGVPSSDVEAVMAGKMEVKPEVVIRLHEIAVGEYQKRAQAAIGTDAWRKLTPEAQAVLTDMAWATGNPAQFKTVLEAMRKGDWEGASANLSLKYTSKSGEQKEDTRRVKLWRLMLSGRQTFSDYLSKHTSK